MIFVDEKMNYTELSRTAFNVIQEEVKERLSFYDFDVEDNNKFIQKISSFVHQERPRDHIIWDIISKFQGVANIDLTPDELDYSFYWFFEHYQQEINSKSNMMRIRRRMDMRKQK